jgi:DNA-binding transcriptional LysR family regulator
MHAPIDLDLVPVFVEVVRREGFSAAARHLGLPRSTVSRQVARLEEQLGVGLLRRTTRRIALTEAGTDYFDRAARALQALEEAHVALAESRQEPRGTLRVSVPIDLATDSFAHVVAALVRRHPGLRVEVEPANRRVDLVAEGYDAAVRAGPGLQDSSLVARKLSAIRFQLVASPTYLASHGRPTRPADLVHHACVLFRPRDGRAVWHLRHTSGEEESVEVQGHLASDDMAFLASLVRAGAGIGMLPETVDASAGASTLERVLPEWRRALEGALYLVYPSARHLPPKLIAFRDFMVEAFARSSSLLP